MIRIESFGPLVKNHLSQFLEDQSVLVESRRDISQISQEIYRTAEEVLQLSSRDEEGKVRFVRCGKNQHVSKLCMCSTEDICNYESLTVDDVVKRDCALDCCTHADLGR